MSLLYCQFSVSAMNHNSQHIFFILSTYCTCQHSIYSRNVLLRIKLNQIQCFFFGSDDMNSSTKVDKNARH